MTEFEELKKQAENQLRISIADIPLVPVGKGILYHIEHTEVIEVTEDMIVEGLKALYND